MTRTWLLGAILLAPSIGCGESQQRAMKTTAIANERKQVVWNSEFPPDGDVIDSTRQAAEDCEAISIAVLSEFHTQLLNRVAQGVDIEIHYQGVLTKDALRGLLETPLESHYLEWEFTRPDYSSVLFTLRVSLKRMPDTIDEVVVRGQRLFLSISGDPNLKLFSDRQGELRGWHQLTPAKLLKRLHEPLN